MDSTRFPGKALVAQTGTPLVMHVVEQARKAKKVDRIIVAAPDQEIIDVVQSHGGEAVLTRIDHPNGTSRIAEVAEALDESVEIIVNVQGDEPEIAPEAIDAVIEALENDLECSMATIATPMSSDADAENPNIVKVVCDQRGRALYFSRAAIPVHRDAKDDHTDVRLRHVGLYAYRRDFLPTFASWSPTPLELREKLEQLRVLEHGHPISVAMCEVPGEGIDTPEQYTAFVSRHQSGHPT